jgi:hypothetical protein
MEDTKNFAGKDGFIWWVGIIEDRNDPLKMGRLKVRAVGWHPDDKMNLPTNDLPWATPMLPTNNINVYAPREGDMVVGFFSDGENAQEPIVMGILPGIALKSADGQKAFSDPRDGAALKNSPRTPESKTYNTDGTGISITEKPQADSYPKFLDEPSTSRIARNDIDTISKTFMQERFDNVVKNVPTVSSTWNEPETSYDTKYPYNNVMDTESGHLLEFDDTPGAERVHISHRNGSFIEWFPNGTRVEKITKDNYSIVMKDDNVYIMGKCNITVQGNAEVYVKGDTQLKVDGNITGTIGGQVDVTVGGTVNATAPTFNLNGDLNVYGNIHSSQEISDATRNMSSDRAIYNGHSHSDPQGGNTGTPTSTQ